MLGVVNMELILLKVILLFIPLVAYFIIRLFSLVCYPKGFFRRLCSIVILFFAFYSYAEFVDDFVYFRLSFGSVLFNIFNLFCFFVVFAYVSNVTFINKSFAIYDGWFYFKKDICIDRNEITLKYYSNVIHLNADDLI